MKLQVVQLGQNVVRVKKAQHQRCPQIVRAVLVLMACINQQIITKGRPALSWQNVVLVKRVAHLVLQQIEFAVLVLVESIKHLMHSQEQAAPFAEPGQVLRVPLLAVATVLPENFKINLVLHLQRASFVLPATNMWARPQAVRSVHKVSTKTKVRHSQ
jgi:hypothetical protein